MGEGEEEDAAVVPDLVFFVLVATILIFTFVVVVLVVVLVDLALVRGSTGSTGSERLQRQW